LEAVRTRKSIRGYKKDLVSKEVIKEILEIATRSPSALNTQPWEFTVVTGEVLDNIRKANVEALMSGKTPSMNFESYKGIYKQRQVDLAKQIFKLMGIAREDSAKRAEWMQRGFRFFDAPAAIIISMDESLEGTLALFDIGAVAQTICLVAMNYGLGTCIEGQGIMYPDVIRKFTGIPDSKKLIMGIAIGYPDWEFPANEVKSEREPVDNITTWHGFTDQS